MAGVPTAADRRGFTLVEIVVALLLLSVAILGVGASTGTLVRYSAGAEVESLAQQAAEDRLAKTLLEPGYASLDDYVLAESEIPGLAGFSRETRVEHVRIAGAGGRMVDYRRITVIVSGPLLSHPVRRVATVAAP